ncbi:DUF1284 domain-containing protein [candidate division FCPU426 bacterium]|nr:DUF1284 domain-containing protein [candidate division FCPU426 bacterium]
MILILRPHHILCRLGFNGHGYSPEFINEMARISRVIKSGRVKTIIVKPGFDNICRSCPHHEYECSQDKFGIRGRIAAELDLRTLRALKLKPGHPYPLPEIDERIASLAEQNFMEICRGCEWQLLDQCRAGYVRLRQRYFPEK